MSVTSVFRRKHRPECVRRRLFDCAERPPLEHAPAGLTIQAVSDTAGVTKRGLFHHFATKRALVEASFATPAERLDADVMAATAWGRSPRGSVTRAYVDVIFAAPAVGCQHRTGRPVFFRPDRPACPPSARRRDPGVLRRHRATGAMSTLEVVLPAADGAWHVCLLHASGGPLPELAALRGRLLAMAPPN